MADDTLIVRGRPPSKPVTKLGAYLLKIMRFRGVGGGASGLADALHEEEVYSITQQMVSRYLTGESDASLKFGRRFADVFALTVDQERELSHLLLRGQEKEVRG